MEAVAKRRGWTVIRPGMHRMDVPAEYASWPRALVVRNPYRRTESIYDYLTLSSNKQQSLHHVLAPLSFRDYVLWYAEARESMLPADRREATTYRGPHIWLLSLSEYADLLGSDSSVIRLERLANDLGLPAAEVPRRNRRRRHVDYTWDDEAIAAATWCAADAARFGYQPPR